MNGADQATARNHVTIAVPGATTASMGLPSDNKQGGVWIMNAGTSDRAPDDAGLIEFRIRNSEFEELGQGPSCPGFSLLRRSIIRPCHV